ncbi:cell adhesion molecule 3 isoform X1 [Paramormyrops kingsleyae]|uniref:Cell adhesion molecule 3 n=1 Tax=Paramormyrops kingsleyae TaxID=1676925 RepID=A0A3B3T5F7_9TELE|nr:cell adhesion molecule 3 isoform X1 [Paramormyrops kingsleyae]XP_023646895.1 cell adhesion molecule 3 isoform X1 [Paramormyrops kingsleyae]
MKVSARHTMLFPTFPVSFLWTLCSVNVFVLTAYSDLLLEDDPFQPVTSDETVAVGGTVTLTCQVAENDNSSLQWSNTAQQTLYFGEKRALRDNRIQLHRSTPTELSITISDVQLSDEGEYTCSIFTMPVRTARATVTVMGVPGKPQLSGYEEPVLEGERITLTCTSSGSKPPAKLRWYRGHEEIQGQPQDVAPDPDDRTFRVRSELHLTVTRADNEAPIACTVDHPALAEGDKRTERQLIVQYSPDVNIRPVSDLPREGEKFLLQCVGIGNPEPTSYEWKKKDGELPLLAKVDGSFLRFELLNKSDNGMYLCQADNGIGQGQGEYVLLVQDAADSSADPTAMSASSGVDHAVIGGVVAVIFFILLCLLIVLGRYLIRHKGTYLTHEAKGSDEAHDADTAIINAEGGHSSAEERKEYFI